MNSVIIVNDHPPWHNLLQDISVGQWGEIDNKRKILKSLLHKLYQVRKETKCLPYKVQDYSTLGQQCICMIWSQMVVVHLITEKRLKHQTERKSKRSNNSVWNVWSIHSILICKAKQIPSRDIYLSPLQTQLQSVELLFL